MKILPFGMKVNGKRPIMGRFFLTTDMNLNIQVHE